MGWLFGRRRGTRLLTVAFLTAGVAVVGMSWSVPAIAAPGCPAPGSIPTNAQAQSAGLSYLGTLGASECVLPNYRGQPYNVQDRPGGGSYIRVAGKDGTQGVFESYGRGSKALSGIYRDEAYGLYNDAAVRSGSVASVSRGYAAAAGVRPTIPASVAAETVPAGASVGEAAAIGSTASRSFGASRVLSIAGKVGKTAWNGFAVFGAFELGKAGGTFLSHQLCSWGIDAECTPATDPGYAINTDVIVTGDPGLLLTTLPASDNGPALQLAEANGAATTQFGATTLDPNDPLTIVVDRPPAGSAGFRLDVLVGSAAAPAGPGPYSADQIGGASCGEYISGWDSENGWPSQDRDQHGLRAVRYDQAMRYGASCAAGVGRLFLGTYRSSAGVGIQYYPVYALPGDSGRSSGGGADPERVFRTTNFCADGASQTAESQPFHESGKLPGFPSAPACSAAALTETKVVEHATDGGAADRVVWDYKVPAAVQSFQRDFPQCQSASTPCTLDLAKHVGDDTVSCYDEAGLCDGWFRDPNKSSTYVCSYGPSGSRTTVALSECNTLSPTFDTEQQAKGVTAGDPRTGAVPGSDPSAIPGSNTDTGQQPGTGGDDDPSGDPTAGALPEPENCWPTGWGVFNPLAWVYQPVKCVLVWAFVPNAAALQQQLHDTWAELEGKPPISVIMPMVAFIRGFATTAIGGCDGAIADFGHELVIPCNPPDGLQGFVTAYKIVIDVGLFSITAFALWRMLEQSSTA